MYLPARRTTSPPTRTLARGGLRDTLLQVRHRDVDALSFIAIFGGLFYWPIFMVFHRHWSFKAKLLFSLFATNLVVLVGFCYAWIYIVHHFGPFDIEAVWPLQFVFPLITWFSLVLAVAVTFGFTDEGNV